MGFLDLFVVAVMPVLKILLITGVGLFLATDRMNLLGPEARNYLNNIVFYLFAPSLILTNLAETITLESLVTLWFMPVNIFLTFIIGSALGWILIKITKTPQHIRGVVIGCCCAGNTGNLLYIIIPAICNESNNPFGESCSKYAEAYAALSMAVGSIFIWSYAYPIVRACANKSMENSSSVTINSSERAPETETLLPSGDCNNSEDFSGQPELPLTNSKERIKIMSVLQKTVQLLKIIQRKINLKKVFAPSTIGAVVGFIIGTISPIRKLLIGDSAPLHVLDTSASLIGEAAIPCRTLIMGANLLKGLRRSEVSLLVIMGIVAVRSIFLPLFGIGIVKAAHHLGLVGSDSLYQFVLMLQYTVPPAMSVGNTGNLLYIIIPAICNESNNPFGESCSKYAEAYAALSMAVGSIFIWSYAYPIVRACANKSTISSSERAPETEALLPSGDCNNSEDFSGQPELPLTNPKERIKIMSVLQKTVERLKIIQRKINLKKVFAPSTIGAVVGFIIGAISPIRKLLIGDSAPLHVLDTSASLIGEAAIPCRTLIMGANLLKGLRRSEVSLLVIMGIVSVRSIFLPLFGIGIVKAAHHLGLVGSDSLYQFVLMLQYTVPPAMSVGTMTQLFQRGQGESSMIMLWTYGVAAISLTLWSTLFMWLLA
ncbi:hypothetical protein PTKIN_Ptkin13bG0206000 [Pterospermum kingtungense]